ncbi:MAG: ROK family protein [Oscillospiraceae bacterium]
MADANEMIAVKNNNFNLILDTLKSSDEMTISQISDATSLSVPTIKKTIDYCVKENMICESSIAPSTGGRKAKLFKICEDYAFAIYFAIDNNQLICRVENFKNGVCFNEQKNISVRNLKDEIDCFYKKIFEKYHKISLISISLPCVVNDGKIIEWFYNSDFNGMDFKKYLEEKYKVAIILENDMNLTVMSVCNKLENPFNSVVATLQFGHNGIGLGQMANGNVLKGHNGFAGEISFVSDIRKDIKSIRYCSKIVRNLIVFLNPEKIVFYRSERQNRIDEIMAEAIKSLPKYAIPEVTISDNYLEDIFYGLKLASKDTLKIDISDIKLE